MRHCPFASAFAVARAPPNDTVTVVPGSSVPQTGIRLSRGSTAWSVKYIGSTSPVPKTCPSDFSIAASSA